MFLKFTRPDNKPIWINSAFVVTVEPARSGGSVVVPIGDGLDYDVKESPETVLAMLAGTPAPAVVPVPAPKSLTKTPSDVSPAGTDVLVKEKPAEVAPKVETPAAEVPPPADEEPAKATKKTTRTRKTAAKKTTTKRTSKTKKAETEPAEEAPVPPPPPPPILTDEQVGRVRKMAPGSIRKLQNTLVAQFKVADTEGAVRELVARGVLTLDKDHVNWIQPPPAAQSEGEK